MNEMIQVSCLGVLFELAAKKSVSDMIVESGGIGILVKAMKGGNKQVKSMASGVLGRLAIDIDVLVRLASQGKIPPLVR